MAKSPKCCAPNCTEDATVEVILYDVYPQIRDVFFERDATCHWLCDKHMGQNELEAKGVREPRGSVRYPFTNRHDAQGFTIYRPLDVE